jgi:hypothetical protein
MSPRPMFPLPQILTRKRKTMPTQAPRAMTRTELEARRLEHWLKSKDIDRNARKHETTTSDRNHASDRDGTAA